MKGTSKEGRNLEYEEGAEIIKRSGYGGTGDPSIEAL